MIALGCRGKRTASNWSYRPNGVFVLFCREDPSRDGSCTVVHRLVLCGGREGAIVFVFFGPFFCFFLDAVDVSFCC